MAYTWSENGWTAAPPSISPRRVYTPSANRSYYSRAVNAARAAISSEVPQVRFDGGYILRFPAGQVIRLLDLILYGVRSSIEIARALATPTQHPNLLGARVWRLSGDGTLFSPYFSTPWPNRVIQASRITISKDPIGAGVHAIHLPYIHALQDDALDALLDIARHAIYVRGYWRPEYVWGIVRPYGRMVMGSLGWRSEFCEIIALATTSPSDLALVSARYPDIPVVLITNEGCNLDIGYSTYEDVVALLSSSNARYRSGLLCEDHLLQVLADARDHEYGLRVGLLPRRCQTIQECARKEVTCIFSSRDSRGDFRVWIARRPVLCDRPMDTAFPTMIKDPTTWASTCLDCPLLCANDVDQLLNGRV